MPRSDLPAVSSFRKQHLLIEYASLKLQSPQGIYLSVTPNDPSLWSGVFFVRKGPYASAVLRFAISFPAQYPDLPPLITFTTDVFHPLVVPLTTDTFSSNASDEKRLPPGGFSLRHGCPQWSGEHETSKNPSGIIGVLAYLKAAFEDPDTLDRLPLDAASNSGAWHAWRSHRGLSKTSNTGRTLANGEQIAGSSEQLQSQPAHWNWEGVWQNRVTNRIESSLADSVLFGPKGPRGDHGAEMIRFTKLAEVQQNQVRKAVGRKLDFGASTQNG